MGPVTLYAVTQKKVHEMHGNFLDTNISYFGCLYSCFT